MFRRLTSPFPISHHGTRRSAGRSRSHPKHCFGLEFRRRSLPVVAAASLCWLALIATPVEAQLAECDQIGIDPTAVPGGCIAKPLDDQIGAGQGDVLTPGSSIYLIKRDPARSIRRGRQLFQRKFTRLEGQGPRLNPSSTGDITVDRILGAGLADSCAACHGRPRGSAGHGGDVVTRPDSRDSPHLFGLGLVEQLAEEMTESLRAIRQQAIDQAANGTGVILDVDFDSGPESFVYEDDIFATSNPSYADGQIILGAPPSDNVALINLGGIDSFDIFGMSGGWTTTFELAEAATLTLSFRFQLDQAANYEADENSDARIRLDNQEIVLAQLVGNGNGGALQTTGQQDVSLDFSLLAGSHTLILGGFNNKKTFSDESTQVFYNNVLLTGGGPGPATLSLDAKGVNFGQITAFPDGTVDSSAVEGVDADLRMRPFFHQGGTVSIREFIVGAMKGEMGVEIFDPVLCDVTDPANPVARTSAAGFAFDPAVDNFERPAVCDTTTDGDGDGVVDELDAAVVDHLEFYLLNYFKAGLYEANAFTNFGRQLMDDLGCVSCHVAELQIDSDRRVADVETVFDPVQGIFNQLFATASTLFDVFDDGEEFPQLLPQEQPFLVSNFFSDLKRHDLGPAFHERDFDGSTVTLFVTEPLWGVGSTSPYGHDGRSINLDAVIRRHGGEALGSQQAYVALPVEDQMALHAFLQTLVLFPPDDTASNLNPGDPGNPGGIQTPAVHGSINLGALFQIPSEGPE